MSPCLLSNRLIPGRLVLAAGMGSTCTSGAGRGGAQGALAVRPLPQLHACAPRH